MRTADDDDHVARLKGISEAKMTAMLAEPPKPERDYRKAVEALTSDKEKQAALLAELAELDEIVRTLRPLVLKGMESAIGNTLRAKKLRAELLRLRQQDPEGGGGSAGEGTVDSPVWAPAMKSAPAAAEDVGEDDVDLNAALEAELERNA